MSADTQTPEAPVSPATDVPTSAATPSKVSPAQDSAATAVQKVSPAQDLRDIQMLLVGGIYPGNMAPMVVKAYSMLEAMAKQVEASVESK
jgi:hypothetical protein